MKTGLAIVMAVSAMAGACAILAQPPPSRGEQLVLGKQVYEYWCATCHGRGLGLPGLDALPGTQQLRIKYRNTDISPLLEERTDLVPDFIRVTVRQGVSFMPQFRKTEISDADLEAIAAFLTRNNPKGKKP
jgi:mono/diheme cytochrome c family protein